MLSNAVSHLNKKVFSYVHHNNLVYNTCWEDPQCDRQLLDLDTESRVVMITSAGCNALDYALDKPNEIHAIDMNPRQNALLELKKASILAGSFDDHWQLFGEGSHQKAKQFYIEKLRDTMPAFSQKYWDRKIDRFIGKGIRKSFYWYSTSGLFAYMVSRYFKYHQKSRKLTQKLFEAQSLVEQRELYPALEQKIMNNFTKWILRQHVTMCLLGVPESQQALFVSDKQQGGFIQKCLRHVFTELPIKDNYFWQLYFNGRYQPDCAPKYLQVQNFKELSTQVSKIKTYTSTLTKFLKENPAAYSHYVLLDHQDWLAANDMTALHEEWRAILDNSRSGTKILLRSAAYEVDFFPSFIHQYITFDQVKAAQMQKFDRVGTYGSVYIGTVN